MSDRYTDALRDERRRAMRAANRTRIGYEDMTHAAREDAAERARFYDRTPLTDEQIARLGKALRGES